jgi:cytochrome c oxidase subunit IV
MSTHTEPAQEGAHDHGGAKVYLRTLITLLFLTVITVAAASFDFGSGNVVIALTIATIKATLVALFFMHLRYEKPVNAVIATAGFLFLGIFLMFCFIDVDARVNFQPVNLKPAVQTVPGQPASAGAAPGNAPPAGPAEKR